MDEKQFELLSEDGAALFAREWKPEGKITGVICIVHGLGEHSGRYKEFAETFTAQGYSVIGFDLRGHGRSFGKRGHVDGYNILMNDINCLVNMALELYPDFPCFLYGHSMGGNLVLNYALRRNPAISGVIASAPWLNLTSPPAKPLLIITSILNRIYPSLSLPNGLKSTDLCHETKVQSDYQQDPLTHHKISVRLFKIMHDSGLWAIEHAREFPLPLLIMHGTADKVTSLEGSKRFAEQVRECTFKKWHGLYHELHNEQEKKAVLEYVLDWLKKIH